MITKPRSTQQSWLRTLYFAKDVLELGLAALLHTDRRDSRKKLMNCASICGIKSTAVGVDTHAGDTADVCRCVEEDKFARAQHIRKVLPSTLFLPTYPAVEFTVGSVAELCFFL